MRWPRGKYNGWRIVGFEIMFRVDLSFWMLSAGWNFGEPCIFIGPLKIRASAVYDWVRQ